MIIAERYALETPLEQGRFGSIYRAADLRRADVGDRADVAIWRLPPELAKDSPARAAFLRDLDRVRELAHPNIARVLDVGEDGDRLFVVSELTDGETLRSVLDALGSERLELRDADSVVEDLGSALAYAHDKALVHGDVRPENVIVTEDQHIKLANFMLASLARHTPFAPALLDDTRALAALAHEVYCGVPPGPGARLGLRGVPRRRRKAIEAALHAANGQTLSASEFLARAGLNRDGRRVRSAASPRGAGGRWSLWHIALPVAGLATIVVVQSGGPGEWPITFGMDAPPALSAERGAESAAASTTASDGQPSDRSTAVVANAASPAAEAPSVTLASATPPATHPDLPARNADRSEDVATEGHSHTLVVAAEPPKTPGARLTLAAYSVTVSESQGVATLDILRTGDSTRPLDVVWSTSDGTAHAGDDYASFGARIESFAPGEVTHRLYIPLASDAIAEPPETFFVRVTAEGLTGADTSLTGEIRIIDDDF